MIKTAFLCLLAILPIALSAAPDTSRPLNELLDPTVYQAPAMHPHPSHDVGDIKAVFYDSIDYNGQPKRVFAYIGVPKSDKPVPAMVLVHGGGGTAFHKWVKLWNDRGYAAIAMDLEGHLPENVASGGGRLSHDHSGPSRVGRFNDAEKPLEAQWMYHAVSDIFVAHTLLASLPQVDADRIGVTGISWGGILSSLVSGIDDRYKCAMPVYGAGYLYESYGHFKSVSGDAQKYWDPARHFKDGSVPTLWVNSDVDGHFSINITSHSFETTSDHAWMTIHPGMKHGHGAGWDPKRVPEIYALADFYLKGEGAPLVRIVKQPSSRSVELTYEAETAIESATVYYLNEPISYRKPANNPKAKHSGPGTWQTLEAKVDPATRTVSAQLPEACMTYYVNLKDSRGHLASSVLVELGNTD
ncbi:MULTISPECIES: S9 family peptidase [unclassified Lentimonas]|uniref:alpha/beta hydrolase family protein n=1 Tax=unclassified Lentimonas TaxID=2630993 RepID=UPI001327EC98|nr:MULTISPECIES: acetylxylan esterase [unclassified Lentimonas]CAA6697043.1 prolyl oligopeptidase family protein [Lentimonas sp. CC19]CAA6697659.1 prolyl oligopeptidase family protein [Lentimonas sp. CC10]CAA7069136.1 prolyl oligopeptidase family protein [Lentimonas sp. CC11]